ASGFIGGRLAHRSREAGEQVRCLVRNPGAASARLLADEGFELLVGDVLRPDSLREACSGVDVAYYLVHSMGRGGHGSDFAESERRAAAGFARVARAAGVSRVIYLGGLGDQPRSEHLRSRRETARQLQEHGPPLTYFRAGMVVGSGSESYRTLRYLVERLPAMIAPAWLATRTQPIGIDDVLAYLTLAPHVEGSAGRELQIGGPDVLTYGQMLDVMAIVLGKRPRPKIPVPFLTPWLSSLWIGLVTPVDAGIARPLIEGLSTETVVTDDTARSLFDVRPAPFEATLRQALAEDRGSRPVA
ncbi:MAG: NAD(P)H-binding protein, partial [Acidobacteriota bacterium]|nr:NAD(P)H-binding protein [Acidobacteriota bacterium]